MYLIGALHPHKSEAQLLLERPIASGQRLVTGAEVLKEILHRHTAIGKQGDWAGISTAGGLRGRCVFAIEKADALRAGEIVQNRALGKATN